MKKSVWILLFAVAAISVQAQNWFALGDGSGTNNEVMCLAGFQGKLVAGGRFLQAGGQPVYRIAQWDGTSWSAMGTGFDAEVRALAVFNDELYAGGIFHADGTGTASYPAIAKWNGTAWSAVPGPQPENTDFRDLYVMDGALYATVHTYDALNQFTVRVSRFDGTSWTNLPGEFSGPENYRYLYALGEYQGSLVAGGLFDSVAGQKAHRVALFDGTQWSGLDFPVGGETTSGILEGSVRAIRELDGNLFLGGIFKDFQDTIAGTGVASYDGTGWTAYPFILNDGNIVYDFEVLDGRLIASGELGFLIGSQIVMGCAMFDPSATPPWQNLNFQNSAVPAPKGADMALFDGDLYIGGNFSHAGTSASPVHNVARFDGMLPTGVPGAAGKEDFFIRPNPVADQLGVTVSGTVGKEQFQYTIYDLAGRPLLRGVLSDRMIDVHNLAPGSYILQLSDGERIMRKPFVKAGR